VQTLAEVFRLFLRASLCSSVLKLLEATTHNKYQNLSYMLNKGLMSSQRICNIHLKVSIRGKNTRRQLGTVCTTSLKKKPIAKTGIEGSLTLPLYWVVKSRTVQARTSLVWNLDKQLALCSVMSV
jgi:hypothetical protein